MDFRVFIEPQQGASYADQRDVAKAAELLGFDGFFRSDHYLYMGDGDPSPGPTDTWVTLAGLAIETTDIRLGTLVCSATFRLPGPLAVAVAQVDQMSGGRIELGLGAGWFEAEHAAYAIPFPELGERFDRLEEQLAVVTGLWATPPGETFDFAGRYYPVADSPGLPKPTQQPGPPIIMGGAGKRRTPSLAARYAAEFNLPFHSFDETSAAFDRATAACQAIDRAPESLILSAAHTVCVGRNDAEVSRRAEKMGRDVAGLRDIEFGGTPAEVVDKIGALADIGATRVYLQLLDLADTDQLELIADQVVAQFD